MILALYILLAIVAVGAVLRLIDRRTSKPSEDTQSSENSESECCGMHITCERDSLLASVSNEIEYFDDEELDVFRGRPATSYTEADTEQFRDVLLTLQPDDIAPWARSVQLRGIELPAEVREELLLIVSEARAARAAGHA